MKRKDKETVSLKEKISSKEKGENTERDKKSEDRIRYMDMEFYLFRKRKNKEINSLKEEISSLKERISFLEEEERIAERDKKSEDITRYVEFRLYRKSWSRKLSDFLDSKLRDFCSFTLEDSVLEVSDGRGKLAVRHEFSCEDIKDFNIGNSCLSFRLPKRLVKEACVHVPPY